MAKFFNKNIKYLRSIKNMSQQGLADKIGIERSTISRIENGEIDTTVENAIKFAEVFNVDIASLLSKDLKNENIIRSDQLQTIYRKAEDLEDKELNKLLKIIDAMKDEDD